ncbi:ATP-binding cassette domain-containing protein [Nocardioides sp.]|uniref:ATP-binding cassette domain-containing protein n=1 Tax=Nocardioides sp. TaxID=35761 RepID=UPI003D0FD1EE
MRIEAHQLGHRFPPAPPLFRDVSFTLAGGLTAVTGPSGSGKSTLLSILAGWTQPATGEVRMSAETSFVWVPQHPFGSSRRTALDHANYPLLVQGHSRRSAAPLARRVLEDFGLDRAADRLFRELSGGEAQRLLLAQASLSTADLLLVDEPTAQLDVASAALVIDVLQGLARTGRNVVIATHDRRVEDQCGHHIRLGRR